MSENSLPAAVPTRQAEAVKGRSQRLKVSGKLRVALDLMVWSGTRRADAAEEAGLVDASLRSALRKPHVLAWYNNELAALRTSLRAKNIHRLDGIAEVSGNDMAKVAAIKTLEAITEQAEQLHRPDTQQPGVQIIIVARGATEPKPIGAQFDQMIPISGH